MRKALSLALSLVLLCPAAYADSPFSTSVSGYAKSLNLLTKTSSSTPEAIDNPLLVGEEDEGIFQSIERLRLKILSKYKINANQRLIARVDYDHQASFGSAVGGGDFRHTKKALEQGQFLDLSQTLVERDHVFYEHKFYRANLEYKTDDFSLKVGRQMIPWGVGRFFMPTDLLNPFNPAQIELDEREGADAVNLTLKRIHGVKSQFIFTPRGKRLHPYRYLTRFSKDVKGYEVGVLGGRVLRDHVAGFDFQGNIKDMAVRGEFLFRNADNEKDFIKFTVNADYNFAHNIYALLEYHHNGQGRRDPDDYQRDLLLRGDIQQLGRNYLALSLGKDITPLLRAEHRMIWNMDDGSLFIRPELQYEPMENLLLTAAAQIFTGPREDEFGSPQNLYIGEAKYSF